MGTAAETVEAILEAAGPGVSARRMFGEYALYADDRVVALVCDDRLYLKPTAAGRALLDDAEEAPPYPGAKPHWVVPEELWDRSALPRLLAATAEALPAPKPPRKPKAKGP